MTAHHLSGERINLPGGAVAWWPCHIGSDTTIGEGSSIGALAHVGQRVTIGKDCSVQGGAYIADECTLGDAVFIGPNAVVLNDKYPPSGDRKRWDPVTIGNGAVIGGNSTIVPGNDVGENAVLAAGAVLTRHLPPNEVWGGNPAVYMMKRDDYEQHGGR